MHVFDRKKCAAWDKSKIFVLFMLSAVASYAEIMKMAVTTTFYNSGVAGIAQFERDLLSERVK